MTLNFKRPIKIKRCWPHLQKIKLDDVWLMSEVVEGFKKGLLPTFKTEKGFKMVSASFYFKLHKAKITYPGLKLNLCGSCLGVSTKLSSIESTCFVTFFRHSKPSVRVYRK